MRSTVAAAVCAAWLTSLLTAQAEKATISVTPKPLQPVHYVTTQEISVDIASEGVAAATAPAPAPPMKLVGKTVIGYTLETIAKDETAQVTAKLTSDHASGEMSLNGMSFPTDAMSQVAGKTYTMVFGADGSVIDVTAPGEPEPTVAVIKAMLGQISTFAPTASLAIGESITRPLTLALPFPIPGVEPVSIDGQVTMTLVSLEGAGADRVANCKQSYDATTREAPGAAVPAAAAGANRMSLTMRGIGTMQINLTSGVITASQMHTTMEGAFAPGGGTGAAAPVVKLRGVMDLTVAGKR